MRDNVISLQVVLGNGDVVKTAARARKSASGWFISGHWKDQRMMSFLWSFKFKLPLLWITNLIYEVALQSWRLELGNLGGWRWEILEAGPRKSWRMEVEFSVPNAELRLLEVFYHKIYKIFPPSEKIENINDQYWTLRAEEIPEEEKNLGPHDRLIHVYHFTKDSNQNQTQIQNFGDPFFLAIHEGETLAEVKARIQQKLKVPDEEFSKWNYAFMSLGRPEYLQESDVVASRFQRRDVYGAWEQYLGLEHSDTAPKRAYTANQNRHAYEKPVKIYN